MKTGFSAPMSALSQYLAPFALHFKRSEGRQSLERHLAGLLADIDCKNGEQIAQAVAGTNSQRLQALLTELQWEENVVNHQRVQQLIDEATTKDGVLVCGETEMPKQGAASIGVGRQYASSIGKVINCQVAVSWQYADPHFSWPVNVRLYLPESWAKDPIRCERTHVPENLRKYLSKSEIALSLLDEADHWGVPYQAIASRAEYASDPTFLAGLENRNKHYVVCVPWEFGVQLNRRKGPVGERAAAVLMRLPEQAWETIPGLANERSGGRKKWTRVRCWRVTPEGQGVYGWLIGERPVRGQQEEWQCYFSNAGPQAQLGHLARIAQQSAGLAEFYREAKEGLGWDHYEGRLWHGFHRHALLVFMAYSFLALLHARLLREGRSVASWLPVSSLH